MMLLEDEKKEKIEQAISEILGMACRITSGTQTMREIRPIYSCGKELQRIYMQPRPEDKIGSEMKQVLEFTITCIKPYIANISRTPPERDPK